MNNLNQDLLSNDLIVTPAMQDNLSAAAKWGRFLAIVGFITCVLMLIGGLWVANKGLGYFYSQQQAMTLGITYAVMAVLFFFPCLFLFKFSTNTLEASRTSNQDSLESGIVNLKLMFRFIGIVTLIMIILYVLGIIFAVIFASR
jgi:hypothetical protein